MLHMHPGAKIQKPTLATTSARNPKRDRVPTQKLGIPTLQALSAASVGWTLCSSLLQRWRCNCCSGPRLFRSIVKLLQLLGCLDDVLLVSGRNIRTTRCRCLHMLPAISINPWHIQGSSSFDPMDLGAANCLEVHMDVICMMRSVAGLERTLRPLREGLLLHSLAQTYASKKQISNAFW